MSHTYFSKETEALEKAAHSRPEIRAARGGLIHRERMPEEGAPRSPRKRRREMPMARPEMSVQLPMMKKGGSARKR